MISNILITTFAIAKTISGIGNILPLRPVALLAVQNLKQQSF
jgi:hypothetical protein